MRRACLLFAAAVAVPARTAGLVGASTARRLAACSLAGTVVLSVALATDAGQATARRSAPPARIVFVSVRDDSAAALFTMNPDGSDVRRLTHHPPFAGAPAWSPDGSRIAFMASVAPGLSELWTVDADGTKLRPLVHGLHAVPDSAGETLMWADSVAWSADGRRILYVEPPHVPHVEGNDELWVADAAAGAAEARPLLREQPLASTSYEGASWSRDGRLVFGRNGSVFVAGADGRAARSLGRGAYPAWSPDGQSVSFVRSACDRCPTALWVIRADGSGARRIAGRAAGRSAWSPDGTAIAYESAGSLFLIRPDGKGRRRVFTGVSASASPTWSPDGKRLAFVVARDNERGALEIVGAAGTGARPLLPDPPAFDGTPVVSPDGGKIAYTRTTRDCLGALCAVPNVYTMNPDGSAITDLDGARADDLAWSPGGTQLALEEAGRIVLYSLPDGPSRTIAAAPPDTRYGYEHDLSPTWSPDGSEIAYAVSTAGQSSIRIYSLASATTHSFPGIGDPFELAWSPDGRTLLHDGIGALDVATGTDGKLAVSGSDAAWSPDGARIAFVRSDSSGTRIHVANADGTGEVVLGADPSVTADLAPYWLPSTQ